MNKLQFRQCLDTLGCGEHIAVGIKNGTPWALRTFGATSIVALVAAPFDFLESLGSKGDLIAGVETECSYVVKTDHGPPWVALGSYLDGSSDPVEFVEDWAQGVSDLAKLLA